MSEAAQTRPAPGHTAVGLTRNYRRHDEVEAEIAALPEVGSAEFCAAVEQARHLETLIYAVRQLKRLGQDAQALTVLDRLLERAIPIFSHSRSPFSSVAR